MSPSQVFPTRPETPRRAREAASSPRRELRYQDEPFIRLARRADWLAEMWSEYPAIANYHRSYARRFRSTASSFWLSSDPRSVHRSPDARLLRVARRAYRRGVYPAPQTSLEQGFIQAQRQKVDTYWAREILKLLERDTVRLSILSARDYELQQLCDFYQQPAWLFPPFMTVVRAILKLLLRPLE